MPGTQTQSVRDVMAFQLAREFMLGVDGRVTEALLDRYVTLSDDAKSMTSLEGIYERLLVSAQNANMKASVIGGSIGGVGKLSAVLCGFSPKAVIVRYGSDDARLLGQIVQEVKPTGQVRRTPRSIWPQFCRAALSGAAFLSQFDSAEDFGKWVSFFDNDDRARPSLPMLLDSEIHGLGFALACDFLKELGFLNFCKPDVHLKKILVGLKLSDSSEDYPVFKAIVRIAKNNGKKPYEIDKLFWLIGSGKFYGKFTDDSISVGKHAEEFIRYAQPRLAIAAV